MRRWILRLLVTAAVLAGLFFLLRSTVFATRPVPVRVAEVARGVVEQTITNSRAGTIKARHRAKMSPEVPGRVVALPFHKGESVRQGDVLLRLDASVQQAQLALARRDRAAAGAQRDQACVAAERARREVERSRRLAADGIVSTDTFDSLTSAADGADAACKAAGANFERAGAAVEVAAQELAKTVLRAPFDGIVADVAVEVGEWTTPSPPAVPVPPVLDVLDPGSIYVSAPMDEVDSAKMKLGQAVRVTVDSYPGRHFPAHLVRIAPYVQDVVEQNRTVEIEVELDDATFSRSLLPGTSADVEVILEVHDDVPRIPTSALTEGNQVLVVDGDHLVALRVETGLRNWDWTEVTGGLGLGRQVVVSLDRPEVKAGAKVEVESPSAATSTPAPAPVEKPAQGSQP